MGKKYILSVAAIVICALAIVITFFTNRNNTGFENVVETPIPTGTEQAPTIASPSSVLVQ